MTEASDHDRFPTLTDAGQRMLERLREHPHAPLFRNASGNRLRPEDVAALQDFERRTLAANPGWHATGQPDWLDAFVEKVFNEVPFYRALGSPPRDFRQVPVISRAELAAEITRFVPDPLPLERLINFRTTGTTGHPIRVPSHPQVAGRYLAFHKRALHRFGIVPRHGRDEVGVFLLGYQRQCFTYVSVTPAMGESGLAKINLHPNDWHEPGDRARYLDTMAPEILAGDPISFAELLRLPVGHKPRALINVSMMLTTGLRRRLEQRFGCPVLDIYSLNEVGPIAVHDPDLGGHVLLQDHLYVEILNPEGQPVEPGQRGEITVSGGFNFCLPLLRYRTGDYAVLRHGTAEPVLHGLVGRTAVRFRHADGRYLNNIDVSHALDHLPLAHYGLHQQADATLSLRLPGIAMGYANEARRALHTLLGDLPITTHAIKAGDKIMQYTSDLDNAQP